MTNDIEFTIKLKGKPEGLLSSSVVNIYVDGEPVEGSFDFVDKQSKLDFQLMYSAIMRRAKNGYKG